MNIAVQTMPIFEFVPLPEKITLIRDGVVWLHPCNHPILTKSDLVTHFRLSGLKALRRKVLTDDVLERAKIPYEEYCFRSIFTAAQTQQLYIVLGINWLRTNQRR